MKPITWLRKFAERGYAGHPVATLAFYGPDNRKATKAVLGIIENEEAEPRLRTWGGETADKDLRYDVGLQNDWVRIIQREGCKSLAMLEEINGCPHQERIDYPKGESCPKCPFWAGRERPIELSAGSLLAGRKIDLIPAIATYKPEQWETFLASAADRDALESSWQQWNTSLQKLIADLEARNIHYVLVELDVDEINDFCRREGIPNNGQARSRLASLKAVIPE
ncbi:MAG TPA: hypothetical protein VE641_13215 [Chthoniobacterales bacterium]|nr:hypothetical protein [Chthoniobacterales bacterium]